MPTAWVLQSNPEKYDIDAALQALDEIRWRVPQHTAGIGVGDPVVIWRSGPEAGIVGIGVVAGAPRAEPAPPLEARFYLTETESNVATRVPVKVQPCDFVPRAEVASLPEMQGHHILTAPRVTVYPLGQGQWEALRKRLPEPPPTTDPQPEPPSSRYPYPYAWRDRRRAVHPLPGGYDSYLTTLGAILSWVTERQPDRDDLEAWLRGVHGERVLRAVHSRLSREGRLRPRNHRQIRADTRAAALVGGSRTRVPDRDTPCPGAIHRVGVLGHARDAHDIGTGSPVGERAVRNGLVNQGADRSTSGMAAVSGSAATRRGREAGSDTRRTGTSPTTRRTGAPRTRSGNGRRRDWARARGGRDSHDRGRVHDLTSRLPRLRTQHFRSCGLRESNPRRFRLPGVSGDLVGWCWQDRRASRGRQSFSRNDTGSWLTVRRPAIKRCQTTRLTGSRCGNTRSASRPTTLL